MTKTYVMHLSKVTLSRYAMKTQRGADKAPLILKLRASGRARQQELSGS